jgi:hypothetical protein
MTHPMRERLKRAMVEAANDAVLANAERPGSILPLDPAECAINAVLAVLREPDTALILAGADVPDSVQRFWPKMIDAVREGQ